MRRRSLLVGGAAGMVLNTSPRGARAESPRPVFLLVHGAWHGGWCWRRVAERLEAAGARVLTPTLTGTGERAHQMSPEIGLDTHIQDVVAVIEAEELTRVHLCGHSYGGMVVTGVCDALKTRLASVLYLDGAVPADGQSMITQSPGISPEAAAGTLAGLSALAPDGIAMQLPPQSPICFSPRPSEDDIMTTHRRSVLIGSALAPVALASAAVAQTPPSTGQLVRCALFVSDLEASTAFYRDGVGLPELLFEGALQGAPLERLLGLAEGAGVRFRILKAEGPPYGMIALFQVTGQTLTRVQKTQGSVNIGEGVLVFHRPDLDALAARLTPLGQAFIAGPERLVDTPQRRTDREVMLRDPDGVLINVIERA